MRTLLVVGWMVLLGSASSAFAQEKKYLSHPPMRPLPLAQKFPLTEGPKLFVDPNQGSDMNPGTEKLPWKTLAHSLRRLKPGDTLYLRGGFYFERVSLSKSGTPEAPITISGYPGEQAIVDGSIREFQENPQTSWEPNPAGVEGEYVSTKSYLHLDDRQVPHQFLPGAWEPMWGIEEERPLALGFFGDSMIPLHGYRHLLDLRSNNELGLDKKELARQGIYAGPGAWFNRETGKIHVRLAHHRLPGLGHRAYQGETDPRQLPLVLAVGFGQDLFRISGIKHVNIRNLVLRGATGSPLIHLYGSENIELDHLTVFGGFPALLINACKDIKVVHCAFRGSAAPWTGRGHMKYRGTASYLVVFQNNQPGNENIEIAYCEFTDDHDFAFFRYVKNLRFHHNYVDNFNDDGLEIGAKLRDHTLFIYQNRIGPALMILTQHEIDKDESPVHHDPKAGVFVYRNVIDARPGVYYQWPRGMEDRDFQRAEGHLIGDHGGPVVPVLRFYHNTVLRRTPVFRDSYLMGLATMGLRNTERDVFNNIFVQMDRVPGVNFGGVKEAAQLREGGNLLWGVQQGPMIKGDPFAKFRNSPLFQISRKSYPAGWTTHDRIADPEFESLPLDGSTPNDLRLKATSPAINAGQPLAQEWPDPLREADAGLPDSGVIPRGVEPWGVGVEGRISLFGGPRR